MSLTASPPMQDLQAEHERALEEELRLNAGVVRLGRMSATKSNHRNLKSEDAAVTQDSEDHRRSLGMANASINPGPHTVADDEDEPVKIGEIMSARDTAIHYHYPGSEKPPPAVQPPAPPATSPPVVTPVQPVVTPVAPVPSPSGMRPWLRNLLIGAAIGGPVVASALTYFLTRPDSPAVSPATPDKDTNLTIEGH